MGVYINMEIPENSDMIVIYSDGTARKYLSYTKVIIDEAKAIPVPPHGRLIDADALEDNNITYYAIPVLANVTDAAIREAELVIRLKDLDAAPTIIPAEEGET